MKALITIVFLLAGMLGSAQPKVLGEADFISIVQRFHPLVKQAALEPRLADAELTSSRGAFDPQLRYNAGRKEFDGIDYYDRRGLELKIPTWYGIDLVAGTEGLSGGRLNPEETRGELTYLGISVPLLQNMVIDKRRAALQQARLFQQQAAFIQRSLVNDIMQDALYAYWDWWEQFYALQLVEGALQTSVQRLNMVKTAHRLGDRPAIDTVEALTQVQSFTQQQTEVAARLLQARYELSTYLWAENETPYTLPEDVVPQQWAPAPPATLDTLLTAAANHPDLVQYNFKLDALQIERRLKFQQLLPDVDLKYQQLGKGYNLSKTVNNAWFDNNYRFGLTLAVPLRLSAGRGGLQQARLKIEQTRLDQVNKRITVAAKVKQYFVEWQQVQQQLNLQAALVNNFATLQKGEEIRFFNGEGSLFLINARELKTLESQVKLVQLQSKNRRTAAALRWSAGLLAF